MKTFIAHAAPSRALMAAIILTTSVAAWGYVIYMAYFMHQMHQSANGYLMPSMDGWSARDVLLVFLMWTLMMIAMMLPSASSMLASFSFLGQKMNPPRGSFDLLGFAGGYVFAWMGYSATAALLQWQLLEARLVSPMMEVSSPLLGGLLLIGAGGYQFTSWKEQCLSGCRSPMSFLTQEWRPDFGGAMRMGWKHGLHCIGCCWLIMLLLFVLGVMNLAWNVALTALVIIEKHVPAPYERWLLRITGAAFIIWGAILIGSAVSSASPTPAELINDICTSSIFDMPANSLKTMVPKSQSSIALR